MSALVASVEAPVFEINAPSRTRTTKGSALATIAAPEAVVEITIPELVRIEERLAIQEQLGDLHPAHATRLAAVSAELDRRWATFA